jgi:putative sterol carrier protein
VVSIAGDRASVRPGRATQPAVTISMSLADFARVAARDLDPGKALVNGQIQLAGDFAVATRLGEMFGEPSPY